jgi:hypothetical protein
MFISTMAHYAHFALAIAALLLLVGCMPREAFDFNQQYRWRPVPDSPMTFQLDFSAPVRGTVLYNMSGPAALASFNQPKADGWALLAAYEYSKLVSYDLKTNFPLAYGVAQSLISRLHAQNYRWEWAIVEPV